ncbi:hypothetical protein, partial [Glutamicibacter sp. AOP3-A1-12]|uniref:hypothetical protein n=1 Tax=Glutamicibacter sp. AOP3-A1-12 TaxID=3457701 RepID=UPI004034F6F4
IIVDQEWIKSSGISLDFVPPLGEIVTLNGAANIHQGGEHVDVTGLICNDLKIMAINAAASIPGLVCGGIDLLIDSLDTVKGAVVLEANAKANISVHHLPAYGQPVDVGAAIVREMLRVDATRTLLSI